MPLTLVIAESSIELVPNEITGHPSVQKSARRKKKEATKLILDQNYHHSAILRLGKNGLGKGRPDIAHFSLLTALGSPLNMENELRCFVHTWDDRVIVVNPKTRLPRNTDRFTSLLEQLYENGTLTANGTTLLSIKKQSLKSLLSEISSHLVVALTTQGAPRSMEAVASELALAINPLIIVGGFSTGHFSPRTHLLSRQYRIDKRQLEAWTVVSRAVYEYENATGLKRL